jgi:hypothetical protein
MNLPDLVRRSSDVLPVANRDEIISRYQHLRMVGRSLSSKLVKRLSKDVLHEGGKKLGILRGGTLVFESEDETSVLMDYCLYDVRRNGRNTIEQYLIDFSADPESDEMTCLRAMQHAIYSLFVVESVERGLGVTVRDLLSNEVLLVVDMGFGSTAQPGLVFASRLLFHDGFSMTGGAALPVALLPVDRRDAMMKELLVATAPENDGYFDPASLIRACLSEGCSSHVQYQEPSGHRVGPQRSPNSIRSAPVGRNTPCPCGSGKKFKQCCMKRL